MASPSKSLQAVKAAAHSELGQIDGVIGFGIGDHVLRIYVRNAAVREHLPSVFREVPVEIVVTGDVSAHS